MIKSTSGARFAAVYREAGAGPLTGSSGYCGLDGPKYAGSDETTGAASRRRLTTLL